MSARGKESPMERRKRDRRIFSEYMRLMNENTGELVGHLADISHEGFRMESKNPIPSNLDFAFRIELPLDISSKPFMVFLARSRWCKPDTVDPSLFDTGFEITGMDALDAESFRAIFEKYGSTNFKRGSAHDYLWGR